MSIRQFPYEPESDHPQYKWNELEFNVRMLTQNSIKLNVKETATHVIFNHPDGLLTNNIAFGLADRPVQLDQFQVINSSSVFVYCKKDTGVLFSSTTKPKYSSIYHGWYNGNLDRCIALIDKDNPEYGKCVLMDSFNSLFEYDQRVPDTEYEKDLFYEGTVSQETPCIFEPGRYRVRLKGGLGGYGGGMNFEQISQALFKDNNIPGTPPPNVVPGGIGAEAPDRVLKFVTLNKINAKGFKGADGANGESGAIGNPYNSNTAYTSSGGGSSGEDSYIILDDGTVLIISIGGAGGGGARGDIPPGFSTLGIGAGGGGAGSGTPGDGYIPDYAINGINIPARGGTVYYGGDGSFGLNTLLIGNPGEDLSAGHRRNGGNGPKPPSPGTQGKGGSSPLTASSGFLKIWKYPL